MAVTAQLYRNAIANLGGTTTSGNAPIDWLSDTLKVMLTTSSYTPNANTHIYKSSITNEITGTGYSAGGATLGSPTLAFTAANSWATTWATGTVYTAGQVIRPTSGNTHLYVCVIAGTSHASTEPTWPTASRTTIADNTATWAECGGGINIFSGASVSWSSSTLTARYAVIYDSTPSTDATRPLVGYVDFGSDQTTNNGTFQITWDSTLGIFYATVG